MREYDLVFISNEKIDIDHKKNWCNSDFLASIKKE